jgi:hypothetical protein
MLCIQTVQHQALGAAQHTAIQLFASLPDRKPGLAQLQLQDGSIYSETIEAVQSLLEIAINGNPFQPYHDPQCYTAQYWNYLLLGKFIENSISDIVPASAAGLEITFKRLRQEQLYAPYQAQLQQALQDSYLHCNMMDLYDILSSIRQNPRAPWQDALIACERISADDQYNLAQTDDQGNLLPNTTLEPEDPAHPRIFPQLPGYLVSRYHGNSYCATLAPQVHQYLLDDQITEDQRRRGLQAQATWINPAPQQLEFQIPITPQMLPTIQRLLGQSTAHPVKIGSHLLISLVQPTAVAQGYQQEFRPQHALIPHYMSGTHDIDGTVDAAVTLLEQPQHVNHFQDQQLIVHPHPVNLDGTVDEQPDLSPDNMPLSIQDPRAGAIPLLGNRDSPRSFLYSVTYPYNPSFPSYIQGRTITGLHIQVSALLPNGGIEFSLEQHLDGIQGTTIEQLLRQLAQNEQISPQVMNFLIPPPAVP